jgi:hypothetical protein
LREGDGQRQSRTRRLRLRLVDARPCKEMADLAQRFRAAADPSRLGRLAESLGVAKESLLRLGVGWDAGSQAWSFPMSDDAGRVVGIRLRRDTMKFAVPGSRNGLFLPLGLDGSGLLLIAEGASDCAALLDLGFDAVGRPDCRGGAGYLTRLVRSVRPREAVIMADRDAPGRDGAAALAGRLATCCRRVVVLVPPPGTNDARSWKNSGATRADVLAAIRDATVHRLSVRVRDAAAAGGGQHGS